MPEFSIVEARIAASFVEDVVLGVYLVTFFNTMITLFWTDSRRKAFRDVNYSMVVVALLMFFNTVIASAVNVVILWRGFVHPPPGGALASFTEISYWGTVLKVWIFRCLCFATLT